MAQSVLSFVSDDWAYWIDRMAGLFTATEIVLAGVMIALAFTLPQTGGRLFAAIERHGSKLLLEPVSQLLAIAVIAVLARALFLPWLGPPVPVSHDEHSLMLQAQTFLEGRLANPTPPFWKHFEAIHINVVPSYASMYFPGRGLPLAFGLLVGEHAWIGVWLSFALMCVASVWMLQQWVAPPFAFLGGLLVVIHLGVFSYWINSYWGGAFTACGGMLVLGAVPQMLRRPEWRTGALMGVGALILLITRPVEGALLCLPVGVMILVKLLRTRASSFARDIARIAIPVAAFAALGGTLMIAYNKAATGDPFVTPYELNREAYATAPAFLVSPPPPGEKRGPEYFRPFYDWEHIPYERRTIPGKLLLSVLAKFYDSWNFYVGIILTPAFLAGLWASRREPILPVTLAFFYSGFVFETWNFPHYTAPIFPVVLVITMMGFEALRSWRPRDKGSGLFLTRAMPVALLFTLLVPTSAAIAGWPPLVSNQHNKPCCALQQSTVRTEITSKLKAIPGRDLILVSSANHPVHLAILYNEPDIARSDIVWANRLGEEEDAPLISHFADRIVWDLEWSEDEKGYRLKRRASSGPTGSSK
ncbi:MAG: hypothetical protein H6917_16885 [Novosphingobium sp.]|nr:hypothetical protein [Novosphingobium sp.]MCP5404050.1 hypothetical protein [Novosphingobium sp.]